MYKCKVIHQSATPMWRRKRRRLSREKMLRARDVWRQNEICAVCTHAHTVV